MVRLKKNPLSFLGSKVQGSEFRVLGGEVKGECLWFKVQGVWSITLSSGFRRSGSWFDNQRSGFKI